MSRLRYGIGIGSARERLGNISVSMQSCLLYTSSGKSSLALGVLYAEGSRRYLEGLSTYTRRRISQSGEAKLDAIEHVPPALALHPVSYTHLCRR